MNKYLQRCQTLLKTGVPKVAVLGNESCDLDSAVSSIALAFHLHHNPALIKPWHKPDTVVFPVLNVVRDELPLKTEVTYFLRRLNVPLDALICSDEIDWNREEAVALVLVDHHVTKMKQNVIGIIDHRPVDVSARFNSGAFKIIELVGSCATLVGREVITNGMEQDSSEPIYRTALELLYGAIVLDTVNFSKEADKAKPLDHEITKLIETHLGVSEEDHPAHREALFKSLVAARSDVSELNAYQLLFKDLKTVSGNGRTVSVPGFPMAVQEYLKLPQYRDHLSRFASGSRSNVVILLGMKVLPDGSVRRDIGVIPIDDTPLAEKIVVAVRECKEMNFELEELTNNDPSGGIFFQQHNLKASRKQLMPIIKTVLSNEQS